MEYKLTAEYIKSKIFDLYSEAAAQNRLESGDISVAEDQKIDKLVMEIQYLLSDYVRNNKRISTQAKIEKLERDLEHFTGIDTDFSLRRQQEIRDEIKELKEKLYE